MKKYALAWNRTRTSRGVSLTVFLFFFYLWASKLPFNDSGRVLGLNYNILFYFLSLLIPFAAYVFLLRNADSSVSGCSDVRRFLRFRIR